MALILAGAEGSWASLSQLSAAKADCSPLRNYGGILKLAATTGIRGSTPGCVYNTPDS